MPDDVMKNQIWCCIDRLAVFREDPDLGCPEQHVLSTVLTYSRKSFGAKFAKVAPSRLEDVKVTVLPKLVENSRVDCPSFKGIISANPTDVE